MARPTITLGKIRFWHEKDMEHFPVGTLRLYIHKKLLLGFCIPAKFKDEYFFDSSIDIIPSSGRKSKPLDEIISDIELSIKEFVSKTVISYK